MRWILSNQISTIARKHSNVFSSAKFLDKSKMDWLINRDNYTKKHLSDLGENDEVIDIDFHNGTLKQSEANELYAVFESFLLLREQQLNYNIAAIVCEHKGGVYLVAITTEDFEKLYNNLDIKGQNKNQIARSLAKMWAHENMYNRRGLILNESEKYREKLITGWNNFINSYDDKFKLATDNSINKYIVWEIIDFYIDVPPGYKVDPGFRSIQDVTIGETGFKYACWDEYNNIWVFGESTGLSLLKFDGAKAWEWAEIGEEEIPYPIQMVIEIKGAINS